ncbi:MAG TPA: MATE family efflux transporter [Candidatus Pelethocola excrementipullorum]|nr:MATE family efflux transporter [Candidatus Pelethocola excrementipullorum]
MNATAEKDLGSGSIGKLLFQLALPAIIAQIINVLYNMVDRMYIGHIPDIGATALTGMGITMPVITAISAFAALVSMGGAPLASIKMGQKKPEEAEKILGNCAGLLVILSLVLTVFFEIFGKDILMIFGASESTIGYAWDYMKIYALGTIFVHLSLGLNAFISAQGYSKISMYTVLLGAICNIILDPIFIFVFDMGVQGAALATIISQALSSIWVVYFLTSKKSFLRLKLKSMKLDPSIILPCLALGLSPFIMQLTESVINVCFNTSLLKYGGDLAVGAMTILGSLMQFSLLPLQGLTQGSQPIISFNYGANNLERVKKTFKLLLISSVIYSTLFWALSMIAPGLLISIFTSNEELIQFSKWAIHIYMSAVLIFGIQLACQQTFIALGNAKTSVFLALLRKVILLIPLIYILPNIVPNPVFGVFLAEPVADVIAVTVTASMFLYSFKKLMRQSENQVA